MNLKTFAFYLVLNLFPKSVSTLKDLYVMGLVPMTGEVWPGGGVCIPAFDMALRHVNERDDVLAGYRLNLIWKDTAMSMFLSNIGGFDGRCGVIVSIPSHIMKAGSRIDKCDGGKATNAMYEMLYTAPIKHMIIGPVCSVEAEVTAQASPAWNITHLSNGGASPLLSNPQRYPRFFRLVSPDTRYNQLRIALIREFGWKRISTINVALDYFSAVTDNLVQSTKGTDIEIISEEIFDHDPLTRLQSLKKKDARIILSASYENHARQLLCAAYKSGLYGPKVVWMFPGWYVDRWWADPNDKVSCTENQMAQVAEGSLLTGFFYHNFNEAERGIANLTVAEFKSLLQLENNYNPNLTQFEFLSPNSYDAIWGTALALNCTDTALKQSENPKSLDQFQYSDRIMADIITSCVSNLSYLGLSGNVKFGSFGDPVKNIRLDQIQGGRKVMVGVYRTDIDEPILEWHNGGIQWKDGVPPRDSTFITKVEVVIPQYLYVVMCCITGFAIFLASSFFLFNIIHRDNVYVKLSSPNINNVLLLGCILTYSCVFMVERTAILCTLGNFTFTIGFSMAFGALFSKTWRVYRIFSNKKLLRLKIKDSQLIGFVLGLVGVLCFVLVLWEIIDPVFIVVKHLRSEAYVTVNDAEIQLYIRVCTSNYYNYFTWSIYIIEGMLLTFGAFLAFETRKVKIAALNDSRLIGTCVYNVVVLSGVGLTLNVALKDQVVLLYGIMSSILIIGTTTTQLIVFIPKVMAVYHPQHMAIYPEGTTERSEAITMGTDGKCLSSMKPRDPCNETKISIIEKTSAKEACEISKNT